MRVNPCFCLTDVTHSKTVNRNPQKLLGTSESRENDRRQGPTELNHSCFRSNQVRIA